MASYRLNIAHVRGCPPPAKVAAALEKFGLPASEEFGVLSHSASEHAAFATIIRKSHAAVQQLQENLGAQARTAVLQALKQQAPVVKIEAVFREAKWTASKG